MNKRNGGIVARGSQRRLGRRPRAPRKEFRVMEETSVEEIADVENDRFTRTLALVYSALRVWELKHGLGD